MNQRKQEIRNLCNQEAKKVAKIIGASAWYEHGNKFLTQQEKVEIKSLWYSMPGNTCWQDAFMKWIKL